MWVKQNSIVVTDGEFRKVLSDGSSTGFAFIRQPMHVLRVAFNFFAVLAAGQGVIETLDPGLHDVLGDATLVSEHHHVPWVNPFASLHTSKGLAA